MDISLEDQLLKSVGHWSNELTKKEREWKYDPIRREKFEVVTPMWIKREELIQMTWCKIIEPGIKAKLESIWQNPHPIHGGLRGVSRYVAPAR